jgi:hypothetical protein
MPRLGKRKNYIGVSVLDGKRSGRKQLPSWWWKEGDSWHFIYVHKDSLCYMVLKYPPRRGVQLWKGRIVDEKMVLRLVPYLAPHNIIVTEQQMLTARSLALQGKTVVVAPVDRTTLKSRVSDLERAPLQPKSETRLKINEEAAKLFKQTN